jgi:hypothetical protein
MQRSSIIATVIATGGILIAGSVASVAVINAASTSQPGSTSAELVAAAAPSPTQSSDRAEQPDPSTSPTPLPSLSDEPLPELPEVSKQPAASQQQVAAAPQVQKSADKPKATKSPKPTKSASASQEAAVRSISVDKAVAVVLDATNGGVVQSADKASRGGYDAWAITVLRSDGSVITGYVDRSSGVAFDWVVVREAPTPSASSTSSSDDDHKSDDHESDDHEHEGDDD